MDSLGEQGFFLKLCPSLPSAAGGEIDKASGSSPPAAYVSFFALRVLDEGVCLLEPVTVGVAGKDARFGVGNHLHTLALDGVDEVFRVWETAQVPVERVAQPVILSRGVAAGQPEAVQGDILFRELVDDTKDFLVAVPGQLRIVHGGVDETQRLLGRHDGAAGQPGVAADHLFDGWAVDQEEVDVSTVSLPVAVAVPVAAALVSHVEDAVIGVVVEEPQRMPVLVVGTDVEGDVLVHRVARFRVGGNRVAWTLAHAESLLVQLAVFLAKAIEMVVPLVDLAVVGDSSELVNLVGAEGQVLIEFLACRIKQRKGEGIFAHHERQVLGGEADLIFVFRHLGR